MLDAAVHNAREVGQLQVSHARGADPSCEHTVGAHTALFVASAVAATQCRAVLEDTTVDV